MYILAIETSCDETAYAIVKADNGRFDIVSEQVLSQMKIHAKYGGVVPEVAARTHILHMIPLLEQTMNDANMRLSDIDYIAVTYGPGLISSLIIGIETAKTLAYALNKPLIGVNHLEGHVCVNFLRQEKITFPALCLIISGGHTQFVLMREYGQYEMVGHTIDDAVGECFDKVAKMLGLSYPGGPEIEKYAKDGNETFVSFPRPMIHQHDLHFSFSGLKTAVKYFLRDNEAMISSKQQISDVCASFQKAVSDVLVEKTKQAIETYQAQMVMISGGVAANAFLREQMQNLCLSYKIPFLYPDKKYCMDNAVMIALGAYYVIERKEYANMFTLQPQPNANFYEKKI